MAINKVVYGDDTLIDLTNDTVTEDDVLNGVTFHDKSGSLRSGSLKPVLNVEVNGDSIVDQYRVANITSDNLSVIAKDLTENKTATVTDGVADFETIDGSLVKSLIVEIEPSQSGSGTPSPDNIRPISGHTQEDVFIVGKNLFGFEKTAIDVTASLRPSPVQRLNVSKINDNALHCVYANGNYSRAYFELDGIDGTGTYSISYIIKNNTTSYTPTFQIDTNNSDATKLVLMVNGENGNTSVSSSESFDLYDIQIELGSTATPYEPYHGKTYTTPFNQTVYGGTLDVLTGELTITHGMADLGSLTWGYDSTYLRFVTDSLIGQYKYLGSRLTPFLSSIYTVLTNGEPFDINWNYVIYSGGDDQKIIVHNHDYTDINAFKTAMSGQTLVYELATPTTLSLTPQTVKSLVGENHISASTGDVLECKFSMLINGDDLEMLLSSIS